MAASLGTMTTGDEAAFGVSAGLDLLSGVFGYLSSLNDQSIANSRADMIRNQAQANATLYAQKSSAEIAQQKVTYLASGVTLAGSPIDVLDQSKLNAQNNIQDILMAGDTQALDQEQQGDNAVTQGRNALVGGVSTAAGVFTKPAMIGVFAGGNTGFNLGASLDAAAGGQGAAANGSPGMAA